MYKYVKPNNKMENHIHVKNNINYEVFRGRTLISQQTNFVENIWWLSECRRCFAVGATCANIFYIIQWNDACLYCFADLQQTKTCQSNAKLLCAILLYKCVHKLHGMFKTMWIFVSIPISSLVFVCPCARTPVCVCICVSWCVSHRKYLLK